ncbi:unnamed protein product [Rotaria sordida]|uniref:E3 ubiquitin-protein ligase n=1 Tax=Rotaria sordida TaxID=392033 RepID=A0A814VWE1_9BILA|nr:unnamed protein product [Rotaria sordida]CAF1190868.1 unnamed protein product [Rotaria sordida]CAF1198127.1 unnamed protein product [Rotaria sordida]
MSDPRRSTPKPESEKKHASVVKKSERAPSASASTAAGPKELHVSTPNRFMMGKPAPKHIPTKDTPSSKPEALSGAPKGLPPQAANNKSQLPKAAAVASNEKNINTNYKDQNDIQEVKVTLSKQKSEIDMCPICLDECTEPKQLDKCGHTFCSTCIDPYFQTIKPQCPCCFTIYGEIRGNQPENGQMKYIVRNRRLPGFKHNSNGTIEITYYFPDGVQDDRHPNPGTRYHGTTRIAYLPNNSDGQHILKLLERAFELRQIFTIGQSRTTGSDNVVTWNDIHHKTSIYGGMVNFGYPDETYFNRVRQELAAKGIQ